MSVCYFDNNFSTQYKCEYEIVKDYIKVRVEYDIGEEIELQDGVRVWGVGIQFRQRDILIIDSQRKKNFLLKSAFYAGYMNELRSYDGRIITTFQSSFYFVHAEAEKLLNLPPTPKVNRIRVYSKFVNALLGFPSLTIKSGDEEYSIHLSRNHLGESVEIGKNGVRQIEVADTWKCNINRKSGEINIHLDGYVELDLIKRVNYDQVPGFVNELILYMQLYFPDKFLANKIKVMVNNIFYDMVFGGWELSDQGKSVEPTVRDSVLDFLCKCYTAIPYRKSKEEFRNIPYIVLRTARNLEDNFLMFYRFIECYYKKQKIPDIQKNFISYSIRECYLNNHSMTEEQIINYSQEIVSLRNHYTHAGYYIKNSSLKISFPRIDGKKNPNDYTVTNADTDWIYQRTKILYDIVIDIIFRKMLGYKENKFKRHF